MNEEEKKAIEKIKEIIECFYCFPNPTSIELKDCDCSTLEIALKLIDKLQKENEELKRKNETLKILEDDIQDKRIAYVDELEFEENYIPKQKVKDKISERQFELQQEYKDFEDDAILIVLQELLEGRK